MVQPIQFPNQYDVIREEAERHLRLSNLERLQITGELMALGKKMIAQNPQRDRVLEMQLSQETAWQEAQKQILARYEARHGTFLR
jgi:hypothetical protein